MSAPILGYASSFLLYELHTDASGDALGAVLYQEQDGAKRVISYASSGLNKAERNYPTHKREFLALKWVVVDKFKDYLYQQDFTVYTDNNPVIYVLTSAKLDATGYRWLASLAAFHFDIRYRSGRNNADADALSRLPATITSESVQAICNVITQEPYVDSLTLTPEVILEDLDPRGSDIGNLVDWKRAEYLDPDIRRIAEYVKEKSKTSKSLVAKLLPVVVSVVVSIDCCLTFVVVTVVVVSMFELFVVDFFVVTVVVLSMFELFVVDFSVVTVVVESMFELCVVDFLDASVYGELCGASDVSIFSVVCSVVIGASQTIRKTCEWSMVISEILSYVEYK